MAAEGGVNGAVATADKPGRDAEGDLWPSSSRPLDEGGSARPG